MGVCLTKMAIRLDLIFLLLGVFYQVANAAVLFKENGYAVPVPIKDQVTSRTQIEPRIVGGLNATHGQFPYQTGILLDGKGFCGGALISPAWVLTAGHCVDGKQSFTVFLGGLYRYTPSEPGRIAMTTRTFHKHEQYVYTYILRNDIAVIKLPEDAPINDQIKVIPLPRRQYNDVNFEQRSVRVSGWGRASDASPAGTDHLQFADLTVISNKQCQMTFGNAIVEPVVCAIGSNKQSPCSGDSGGPLVITDEETNTATHFGVVSFGSKYGCETGGPTGYFRTYKFLDWINSKTGITIQE